MHRRHLGWLLLLVLAGALGACAEQQPAINRVEAYALPKSLFAGEWLYGQTVVDVPGTNTVTMVGNTNYRGLYRVRWDIQEGYLYARKADELIEGAKRVDTQTGEYKGTIVGAWAIESHFDVKRAYNPTTGEEQNVVEENASDCKWYDCKYMRVKWAENLAIDYAFLDSEEYFKKEAMPFYEQDANDPRWRPIFDEKNGYIDVTSSVVIKPESFYFARWNFNYPLCWAYENMECTPEVTKIRNSFWRRDPNRDFEPRQHGGPYDEWFGFFVQERLTWENHYGITYKTKKKLINRHNLWDRHHHDSPEAACLVTMEGGKTGDKYCSETFGAGSRCDSLIRFHVNDVVTDTDHDGLPDSFESEAGLDAEAADSNTNRITDANEDKVSFTKADGLAQAPNGVRDLEDFYAWDSHNMVHRCTIPMQERDPVPVPYYNTGFFPRSLVCDEAHTDPTRDSDKGPCEAWNFVKRADWNKNLPAGISTLHKISLDYDETYWKSFLRGVFNFSVDEYTKWITTHDINALPADKQEILRRFGDDERGYYAFTICPNNPVQEYDPWPCRFPHMPFSKASALMAEGRKFGTVDELGKEVAPYIRHGDIRYSMVNYVKDYYDGWALLGLGPSMTDPVTGENYAGVANVYALNDWAATNVQEMVQLLNGQISPKDFINGVNLENFLKKITASTANDPNASTLGMTQPIPPAQIKEMYQAMRQGWLDKLGKGGDRRSVFPTIGTDEAGNNLNNRQLKEKLIGRMASRGILQKQGQLRDLSVIKGTPLEKHLIDEDILMASGMAPGSVKELTPDVLNKASLARGGFLRQTQMLQQLKAELSHKRNMDFVGMADDALDGLAARLKNLPPEKVWATTRDIIMRAVLTHEMGHTVGLHHNWAGSEDALNFFDEYWKLRSDNETMKQECKPDGSNRATAICPFAVKPMSNLMRFGDPGKGLNSLYEYSYSSIMDYAGKYTSDGNGLGKYDKAAIMYGHVDKVEVFEKIGSVPAPAGNNNVFEEWFTSSGNPFWLPPPTYELKSYHYTNWYAHMGPLVYQEQNRKVVDYRDVKLVKVSSPTSGEMEKGWFYKDPKSGAEMPRIPYAFCSYTRGDISDGCNTRDFGSDHYERMKGDVDAWETWYVLRAFPRFEFGADKYDYVNRSFRRYERLKNYNDNYAINQGFLSEWFSPTEMGTFMTDTVNGWGNYTIAMKDAYNMAIRTLAMPDVKSFELLTRPDGQKIFAEVEYRVHYRNDISNSRYFGSSWRDTSGADSCGFMWWECLHHNGFYLDKVVALFSLGDPFTNYAGVDTSEDIREWRVGFFENYSRQLVDFFGALLAEDYDKFAPWVDLSKPKDSVVVENGVTWANQMAWRDYATAASTALPGPAKPGYVQSGAIESATRFTFMVYAAIMGMLLFQDNFDNEFIERARIWKKGKDTTWTVTPGDYVDGPAEFNDPFNGSTYVGIGYKDKRGIAQRMIAHANKLKSHTDYCTKTPGAPDSCETVPKSLGCEEECMKGKASSQLYKYRQLMDIMIQVTTLYNASGGNWSWDPFDP